MKTVAENHRRAVSCVRRVAALEATGTYNAAPQVALDALTAVAVETLGVPAVLITLIHRDQQFILSTAGVDLSAGVRHQPLSNSFCRNVVDADQPMIIANTADDDRVNHMPAASVIIAYAGIPIRSLEGHVLGSLCAVDVQQRDWSALQIAQLTAFAAQASLELQSRERASRKAAQEPVGLDRFVVHDLRTPLSSTLMGLELIPRSGALNDEQEHYLNLCRNGGAALLEMIDQLLDLSNMAHRGGETLSFKPQRPCELVARAIDTIAPLATGKSIQLIGPISRTLPSVRGDSDKLTRVLLNLLGNAIKFTEPGGKISIEAAVEDTGKSRTIRFSVTDNGIGIASDETDSIFHEGFRHDATGPTRAGTGLGLAFCRQMIAAHGGTIRHEPVAPQGSRLTFTLPTA